MIRFVRSDELEVEIAEVYFSIIEQGQVKAWRRHQRATMFLTVPAGIVRFVVVSPEGKFVEATISPDDPCLLTIPPGRWFGFQAIGASRSIVASACNMVHDPSEVNREPPDFFSYEWSDQ